jgi:hypothetical protein
MKYSKFVKLKGNNIFGILRNICVNPISMLRQYNQKNYNFSEHTGISI